MNKKIFVEAKIMTWVEAFQMCQTWRLKGEDIVFTNGCFDILHQGHVQLLLQAAEKGNKLVVGLNSDNSVRRLKGKNRPIQDEYSRALLLAAQLFVDAVVIFDDDTPLKLINHLKPHVLVKGGDYKIETIVGAESVLEYGGKVEIIPLIEGYSTTNIIDKANQ